MERVGDMTREELKQLVDGMVDEQIGKYLGKNGGRRWINKGAGTGKKRSWRETSEEIDRIGWSPPATSESPHEMLRADRAR